MPHVTPLLEIWRMLDICAPDHERKQSGEYWTIKYNGKSYRSLPVGPHGRRVNPDIETGHVRSMARHLGILDCARQELDLS